MNFYTYTSSWIKGELFESKIIFAFGIATIILGFLFSKIGTTPNAKALFIPLLLIGIIYGSIGANMLYSNTKRMKEMPLQFQQEKTTFIKNEKQRVEGFQYQYKISKLVATICFIFSLFIFWYTKNSTWQGIAIGVSYFGLAGLVIDYFSEERASMYYQEILKLM